MIKNYFITAFRNLRRNKFYSLINIFGLSIGIATCMLILLYTKDEVSYDRFHENGNSIYRLTADLTNNQGEKNKLGSTGMMPGPVFKEQVPEVVDYVRVQSAGFTVKKGTEVFDEFALYADANFFTFFTFPLTHGNKKHALDGTHSVVISEKLAEKYFGSTDVVGKTLEMNTGEKFEAFEITGVVPESPQNSSLRLNMVVPMKFAQTQDDDKTWMNFFLNTFVAIAPGSDLKKVEAKMNKVFLAEADEQIKKMEKEYGLNEKIAYNLQPLTEIHLSTDYRADNGLTGASNPVYSYILSGIAVFMLIIACVNFINLTVARSLKRAKEIGVRKVVGSERRQLIYQFLGESFIITLLAFIISCALTAAILPFFNAMANKELAFSYLFDWKLIGTFFILFIITGLLAGFYPALVLSNFNPVETLYGRFKFNGKNYLSKGLVVLQFSLATLLIISTITVYLQFNYLVNYSLGYDDKNVMVVNAASMKREKFEVLKNELLKSPLVKEVSGKQPGFQYTLAHINGSHEIDFNIKRIDDNYFSLFKIPVVKGRLFSKEFPTDSISSVVVNESFVKTAGWKEPIGQIVDFFYDKEKEKFKVIGVVKDYHFSDLKQTIGPELFTIEPAYKLGEVYIKTNEGNKAGVLNYVEGVFKKQFPSHPYSYIFKDDQNRENYEDEAKWKQIMFYSALLTIFISCIGLFGLASLAAEKRAKEMGIRKVFGASISIIIKKLTVDFIKLVIIACVISAPIAWLLMNKWLQNYPYKIELSVFVFLLIIMVILFISFITVAYQALKSARANPIKSLRTE